jgi:hypothetical protein
MKSKLGFSIFAILLFVTIPAYSLDVALGVSSWYAWWSSSLEDKYRGDDNAITAQVPGASEAYNDTFESDPHLMVGPILNIKFSDTISLGFVMLISQSFNMQSSYDVNVPGPDTQTTRVDAHFRRYDGDLTVNYRIGSGFGIFCGIKFFRWEGESSLDITSASATYSAHVESDLLGMAAGPAAGLSYTRLLSDTLFLTASVSGVIMMSDFEQENIISDTSSPTRKEIETDNETYYAFNGMAGVGYYIGSLKSTVILGGRFQYLDTMDDPRDLFYGITATALYHF